jgi:hypothetical protein
VQLFQFTPTNGISIVVMELTVFQAANVKISALAERILTLLLCELIEQMHARAGRDDFIKCHKHVPQITAEREQ